jgi:hypothetical protein
MNGGELVQSVTYREAYVPAAYDMPAPRRLLDDAPAVLRSTVAGAWLLVSLVAAGGVLVLLVLVLVRLVGVLA